MRQPRYPQKPLLPKITDHRHLPVGAKELARINDRLNYDDLYIFLKIDALLVIVKAGGPGINSRVHYAIGQFEAPLGLLSWFPKALQDFIKPPAEGGLPAGVIASNKEDVEGDMLSIISTMSDRRGHSGYDITNYSRPNRASLEDGFYSPSSISFSDNFLYEGGLLNLITELGEKYEKGQL